MEELNFEHLNHILKAPSKEVVHRLCNEAFLYRHDKKKPKEVVQAASENLSVEIQEAQDVLGALSALIKNAVFEGSTEPADIVQLFPSNFHKNLRDLLGKVLIQNIPRWKEAAANNLVSLPRLAEFDWRVDVKSASDSVSRMSVPTCILQLKIEDSVKKTADEDGTSLVNVELSKETLDTMLDGLGKIRDQLSAVSKT